jgi:hypothetical protein
VDWSRKIETARFYIMHSLSRVVIFTTQGLESGGSKFETSSEVIVQAELLKCGHNSLVKSKIVWGMPKFDDKAYFLPLTQAKGANKVKHQQSF